MVGLYQLTLKVAVEMSMLGNELSAPALFIRVSNLPARIPSRYDTLRGAGLVVNNLLRVVFPSLA